MQEGGASLAGFYSPNASADPVQSPDFSGKSKKRERPDHNESVSQKDQHNEEYASSQKRECVGKCADEGGGLCNIQSVDQLIVKMKQEQAFFQRSKLVGIVTATSKEDCLRKFVQLGGVPILEQWIQDGFKSRSSDAGVKESDKDLDDQMLKILQALEKLPVDLEALKGCSIGKSVKQLRSVRNVELQKKARKLVDTWRKRVDFEIKQGSTMCAGAREHTGYVDSMPYSDLSPARNLDCIEFGGAGPLPSVTPLQEVNDTPISTPSNASTSDANLPKADEKPKIVRVCSMSASTTLSPSKRQKYLTALAPADKDCKEEISNVTDSQNRKECKYEISTPKMELNSNAATGYTKKTNEYRKKLRSGGSTAAPCGTDLHTNVPPSNIAQTRDNAAEKNGCSENNTGDSEQDSKKFLLADSMNATGGNEAPDPPSGTAGCKELEVSVETYSLVGKVDHVNESCLSSQSSCTDKQADTSPVVTFELTKMSSHTSQLQGDTKDDPLSKHLLQKIDGASGGLLRPSMKSMSCTEDCSGGVCRCSTAKPELKHNTDTTSKRNELADAQQGAAPDGEESCCSYDNATENAQQVYAYATVCMDADGGAYSKNTKAPLNLCQESAKEQNVKLVKDNVKANETLATTHSCHDFDLNEGLAMDEFLQDTQPSCFPQSTSIPGALAGSVKATSTLSAPVAVSAAAKGAFIPLLNSLHKCDIGWKGSAATSAFRPAEPRVPAKTQSSTPPLTEVRNVNSFDLNVADLGNFEDDLPFPSRQQNQASHLDLNRDGRDAETQIMTPLLESCARPLLNKRPIGNFDLNEQLDEVVQEQEVRSTSVAGRLNNLTSFGGSGGCAPWGEVATWHPSGDVAAWHPAGSTPFPPVIANVARMEQFFAGTLNHAVSSRQATSTTLGAPPSSSVVYSQSAPFFGGAQMPFPASFGYSAPSTGAESQFLVSKMVPSPAVSAGRSRQETSFVRPAAGTSMDDMRGGNGFYSWRRPLQNIYGCSSGPTIISYNDAAGVGREHTANFDGSTLLEDQMRFYQQAAVPLTSLKRKDSEYFPGLKQSTWH